VFLSKFHLRDSALVCVIVVTLKMRAVDFSEMLVMSYQSIRRRVSQVIAVRNTQADTGDVEQSGEGNICTYRGRK